MKKRTIQFKFLITLISAMLAVTMFIGGLSIYEVDNFVQSQTEDYVNVTCEKNASQINDAFGDMEKSVHIMESYVYGLIENEYDIKNPGRQAQIIAKSDEMFIDVAKNTDDAVAFYFRFALDLSDGTSGFFYTKEKDDEEFTRYEATDLSIYDRNDTEHVGWYWQPYEAGKPVWMMPYYNKNNDIYMISYVVPLYYNNQFFGVVGVDFDFNVLTDKIHQMKIYENGFAHLEHDGKVVHDDTTQAIGESKNYLRVSKELKNGMNLVLSASYKDIEKIRYDIGLKIVYVVVLLAIIFSLIVVFVVRRIVQPLNVLTDASIKLSKGDYDVEIVHSDTYEIKLLSTAFENMTLHLKEHEKLQHLLAYRDSLTGLRNTNSYKAWVTDFDKEIESEKLDFGVIIMDINYLKETNDRYGHDSGNKLIAAAAQIMSGIFKRSPVFRIGGDEFLIILQNRDLVEWESLMEKFDAECANETVALEKVNIPVSIAKGFARYNPETDSTFVDVFNRADDAMYENKRNVKVGFKRV